MDDYISRKTAMNAFAEYVRRSNNSDFAPTPTWNDAVEIVEALPSADVVDVVRCRDCKFGRYDIGDRGMYCGRKNVRLDTYEDDFCSFGERKDGEQNDDVGHIE